MFISFDYRCDNELCPSRTYKIERLVMKEAQEEQHCKTCHVIMKRLPAAPRTTFRFADKKLKP